MKLLLDRNANIKAQNYDGDTALLLSLEQGNTKRAELLIDYDAHIPNEHVMRYEIQEHRRRIRNEK